MPLLDKCAIALDDALMNHSFFKITSHARLGYESKIINWSWCFFPAFSEYVTVEERVGT